MAKENKKDTKKNKKHFFKDLKAELKKVIWPTPKQLVNNTTAVITIVVITAVIVLVLDLGFETINKYGIDNIKKIVESNSSIEEIQEDENSVVDVQDQADEEDINDEHIDNDVQE